jgi:hypothetical protein
MSTVVLSTRSTSVATSSTPRGVLLASLAKLDVEAFVREGQARAAREGGMLEEW